MGLRILRADNEGLERLSALRVADGRRFALAGRLGVVLGRLAANVGDLSLVTRLTGRAAIVAAELQLKLHPPHYNRFGRDDHHDERIGEAFQRG